MAHVTQGHHRYCHDRGHEALDRPAGEGPGVVVNCLSPGAPVYGDQHRGEQTGHQRQQRVSQGQVSDKQDGQPACGHLGHIQGHPMEWLLVLNA